MSDDERDPQRCSQGRPPFGPDAIWTPSARPTPFRAWRTRRRRAREFDRLGFHELATYNAEKGRGVVHTPAMQAKMAVLQAQYDLWAQEVRDA
jgi:hypothetical protein